MHLRTLLARATKGHLTGLLVAMVVFLVYANSLGNGFVMDDASVILNNPVLRGSPFSLFERIDINSETELTPYYRPLSLLTFLVEGRLHGFSPFPMHLLSVLLHAANAYLVYRLASSLINNNPAASVLAGLLFAVHPINTEGVDFISARNTLLVCFFILASYLVHERSIKQGKKAGAVTGAILFMAGLFSKEPALGVFPFICFSELPFLRGSDPVLRRRAFVRLIPYTICLIVYFILRNNALSLAGVRIDIISGLGGRLMDNVYIIPKYLLMVVWPLSLSPEYDIPQDFHLLALPLVAAWVLIVVLFGWLLTRGRSRTTLFGLIWFAVFLVPVSGIIPIPSTQLAARYLYIPAIGLWLVMADQAARLLSHESVMLRRGMTVVTFVLLLLLAGLTIRRNLDWKNDITIFSRAVEQYPDNAVAHAELGMAYYNEYRLNDSNLRMAEQEFKKALDLEPALQKVHTLLGSIHLARGDEKGAMNHYTEALSRDPFDKEALVYRGMILENLGRPKEAVNDYQLFLSVPGSGLAELRPYAEARIREITR